ncbi:hypothetical protein ACTI_73760 [Actinoplanes sp. OR16]|nr:hypothetical protein ACTI_73760 [Actinoplanes sp. OR16]
MLGDPQRVLAVALQAYVAMNTAGQVVAWNPAAQATFGHTWEQACGRDLAELIIPVRYREQHRAGLARVAAGAAGRVLGRRLQLAAMHRDGHEFPIELMLTATDEPAGTLFHAFAQDMTTAQRVSRFTAVEAAVSRGLAEASCSTEAATRVVDALGIRMGWPVAELWLADDSRRTIRCAARYSTKGLRLGTFALSELEPGMSLPGRVYQQGTPDWIPDLASDTASLRSRAAARAGLHVAVGVPVSATGHTLGALCVYGDRIEDPEDTLAALLMGIAAQIGQYLERRRAEELTVELARTKDEFLALVTHEIRNPLAVIVAAGAMLEEDLADGPVEHREHVRAIAASAGRLTLIADDLLDLARLESGNLAISTADLDLRAIIDDAVQAIGITAQHKNLTITVDSPASVEMHADPHRLRQVADNLISNAVKYTPARGRVTITVTAGDEQILWQVADTGIGIPAADRPHLFRRFYRASTAIDQRIPGTGLGLVITRTIVERHHGTITVADTDGAGTTFEVRLPVKPPSP